MQRDVILEMRFLQLQNSVVVFRCNRWHGVVLARICAAACQSNLEVNWAWRAGIVKRAS